MAKRTRKTTRKTKQYTLSEFKAWLEGVEELQPDDWAPNADQWKTIREKLMNIVEDTPMPASSSESSISPPASSSISRSSSLPQKAPVELPPSVLPPATELPASDMTPAAAQALNGKLPSEMVPSSDGRVKTPNIDTTDGKYGSSFE